MFTVVHDPERLYCRVFGSGRNGARLAAYRIDDSFNLDIELPGVDPAAIDISVADQVLTVRAERKHGEDGTPGPVQRQVPLSDKLDTDRIDAGYDDGVLTLRIPISARTAAS
jgi:HSP20 family protein